MPTKKAATKNKSTKKVSIKKTKSTSFFEPLPEKETETKPEAIDLKYTAIKLHELSLQNVEGLKETLSIMSELMYEASFKNNQFSIIVDGNHLSHLKTLLDDKSLTSLVQLLKFKGYKVRLDQRLFVNWLLD